MQIGCILELHAGMECGSVLCLAGFLHSRVKYLHHLEGSGLAVLALRVCTLPSNLSIKHVGMSNGVLYLPEQAPPKKLQETDISILVSDLDTESTTVDRTGLHYDVAFDLEAHQPGYRTSNPKPQLPMDALTSSKRRE